MKVDWIKKTKEGIQVKDGSFFVDPIYPVKKAIITHGHADHARAGHEHVIATLETLEIMKERYGSNFCKKSTELKYHEKLIIEEVEIFLAPAGHVLGSAQVVMNFAEELTKRSGTLKASKSWLTIS